MPWFKIDDGFHCHPKVLQAGTPAVGLYVRCGSWAAQQTTNGVIPKHVATMYGTARQIKALVDAGLWHQPGHGCESCAEVNANSYLIHDYLEKNPSRNEVESARKAKSERQQRWREGKRKDQANGPAGHPVDGDVDASTARHGDAAPTPAQPSPSQASPTEKPASRGTAPTGGPRIPDFAADLVQQMTAAGMVVGWGLADAEWFAIHDRIKRVGLPTLIDQARRRWNQADPPKTARYLLRVWCDLPDAAAPADGRLHAVDDPPITRAQQAAEWYRAAAQKGQ
jgi:hypothetical protein